MTLTPSARFRTAALLLALALPVAAAEQPVNRVGAITASAAPTLQTERSVSLASPALTAEARAILRAPLPPLPVTVPAPSRTVLLIWMLSALLAAASGWMLWRTEGRA